MNRRASIVLRLKVCSALVLGCIFLDAWTQLMADDTGIREPDGRFECPDGGDFRRIFFTPDGKQLVGLGIDRKSEKPGQSGLGMIGFWDVSTRKLVAARRFPEWVAAASFAPDGKRLVASYWDNRLRVLVPPNWEIEQVFDYDPPDRTPLNLAILADGKRLLIPKGGSRGLRIWDLDNRQSIAVTDSTDLIEALAVSKDGKRFAVAYLGPLAEIWDAEKLQVLGRLHLDTSLTHSGVFVSVAFSPDGKTIAAGYGAENRKFPVGIWDAATFQRLHTCVGFAATAEPAQSIAYSADSKLLAGCSGPDLDKPAEIILWEVSSGKMVYKFHPAKDGGGMHIALSPDGKWLVHCSARSVIRLWDFEKIRREIGK